MIKKDIEEYLNANYNPKQDFRHYNHIGYIIKAIKKEQKIESINYYLNNIGEEYLPKYEKIFFKLLELNFYNIEELVEANAFERIFSRCTPIYFSRIPSKIYNNKYFIEELLLCNIDRDIYDYLPKELRENEIIKQKFNRTDKVYNYSGFDINGYNRDWIDKEGNLICFFNLSNGFEILSKEEYLKLVKEYINSNVSVPSFCEKYKISSVEGFNKLLNRVSKENLEKNKEINEVKSNSQDLFKKSLIIYIKKIINNDMTMYEYFEKYYRESHNINILINFSSLINFSRDLVKIIIDFYYNYDKPYSNSMVNFLNDTNIKGINNPFNYFKEAKYKLKSPDDNIYQRKIKEICNRLNKYKSVFNRNNSYITYKINDLVGEVNDNVIDQALAYINDNNIYLCSYSVNLIAKDIAFGKINYKDRMNEQNRNMKNNLNDLLDQAKTIEDYIRILKNDNKLK